MEKGEWRSGDICWDSPRMTVISNDVEAHAERKKRRRFTGASCQVPFCGNPLELQYHKKYHVCREHFAAPCVALEGVNSRFCQKCGKFQAVDAFDAEKRTCRVALAQHNARRRKCDKAAVGSPPGSAAAGGSSSGGAAGSAGNATAAAAAGASSRAAGSACAASNGAVRPGGGAAADGRIGTGAAVLLATPEGHGSQQGAAPAALDGSPPLKRQQVGQRQRQQAESPQLPVACSQALPPGSARAQQQQAHVQVQTALPPEQPLAGREEERPAALLALRKPAGHRQRKAPVDSGAPADTAAPPAPLPTGPSARLCAAALDGSGSAGSNGAALPGCWPAQQGLSDGRPLPGALPGALLHAPDLIMLTSGSSGSMGPVPSGVLALQPGSHLLGARQPCSAPARTGWAPASHEDRLLSVSPLGGLPDSCFAEPSGLPFLHPPCTTGQQQQHQQQQWQAQAGGLAEQPSGNAAALGGFAAFSTNLPVSLQVEARPAPTVQQPPVRLAQHPGAAEHQLLGQLEGPAQHRPLPAAPGHPAALSYAPPTSLHRISLKIFQCTPEQLAPGIREELEAVMGVAPAMLESYIRPGCTRLTVDMRLPRGQAAAAAATRDAASLLHALRVPRALGSAATNATVLQCALGGLARAPAGGGAAEAAPAAPPCLAVRPACIALPPDGQPWQLLGLQLLPAQEAGWDLGQTTVLARQLGRHLAVSMWGTDLPAAQAASYAACGHAEQVAPRTTSAHSPRDSGIGSSIGSAPRRPSRSPSAFSGEDGTDSAFGEPCDGGVQPACLPGSRAGGCLWVRLSGLRPGCCELEAERLGVAALPAGAAGAAHRAVPLLSHPAPLLVLRDAAEADEVQRLVGAGGLAGREGADSLLRDIGLAAAYLESIQAGAAAQAGHLLPPPALVAATAAAALAFVQQQGMPAVERLLRRALAAATGRAATAGGSTTTAPSAASSEPAERAVAHAAAVSARAAGNGPGKLAEGAGAASCADEAPLRHPPSKADGKLGVAKEASWEADPCSAAEPTGKAAATGGSGRQGPSCTVIRVQALMQDVEGLAAGGEPADTARQPGCLGSLSARGQGLSWHGLLRLGAGLAAFFVAVIIVRLLPVAG